MTFQAQVFSWTMSCFALGGSLSPAISGVLADPCTTFAAVQKSALCAGNTAVLQRHPFLVPFALLAAAGAMACAVCAVIMQPGASIHDKCEAVLRTASSEEQPADGASAPAPNMKLLAHSQHCRLRKTAVPFPAKRRAAGAIQIREMKVSCWVLTDIRMHNLQGPRGEHSMLKTMAA